MPIYEYQCEGCEYEFEQLQRMSEPPLTQCPSCGKDLLKKKISAVAFRLKGGGWYETDFKSGDKKNVASSSDSGGESTSSSESKSETKSSSPTAAASSTDSSTKSSSDSADKSTKKGAKNGSPKSSSKNEPKSESKSKGSGDKSPKT